MRARNDRVFSVGPASAPMDWLDIEHVTYVFCDTCPGGIYKRVEMRSWNIKLEE
jgi:hypothetical protein